jgi:hypothetical protein
MTYVERLRIPARIFDERYGTNESAKVKQYVTTEGDAKGHVAGAL